eukprot:124880-Prymnesium_polylepis.1
MALCGELGRGSMAQEQRWACGAQLEPRFGSGAPPEPRFGCGAHVAIELRCPYNAWALAARRRTIDGAVLPYEVGLFPVATKQVRVSGDARRVARRGGQRWVRRCRQPGRRRQHTDDAGAARHEDHHIIDGHRAKKLPRATHARGGDRREGRGQRIENSDARLISGRAVDVLPHGRGTDVLVVAADARRCGLRPTPGQPTRGHQRLSAARVGGRGGCEKAAAGPERGGSSVELGGGPRVGPTRGAAAGWTRGAQFDSGCGETVLDVLE